MSTPSLPEPAGLGSGRGPGVGPPRRGSGREEERGLRVGRALLAVTLLVAGALVATVLASYAAVRDASSSLIRAQGDALQSDARTSLRERGAARPPAAADLAALLGGGEAGDDEESGVEYALAVDPRSGRWVEAGTSTFGAERVRREALAGDSGHLVLAGERALFVRRLPPDREQRARYPGTRVPREELTLLAVEYVPRAAQRLEAAAARTLAVGGASTLVLLVTALGFARLLRHRAALERALAREGRLAALGEMSAVLAHELRNPLASLKGHAQLLLETLPEGGRERQKVERILGDALRLEQLCGDLLDFVRSAEPARRPTELAPLLRACAEAVPGAAVELALEGAPERWPLDGARVQQVVSNLLRNAAEASAPGAPIRLEARVEEAALTLLVTDRGEGLPPGGEERIFEPFHTTRVRGTGLGLAVARRLVELHGGTITARNRPGGGAELRVVLPGERD